MSGVGRSEGRGGAGPPWASFTGGTAGGSGSLGAPGPAGMLGALGKIRAKTGDSNLSSSDINNGVRSRAVKQARWFPIPVFDLVTRFKSIPCSAVQNLL